MFDLGIRAIGAAAMVLLGAGSVCAQEQVYRFVWKGAGGYSMHGALSFVGDHSLVREDDIQCFEIEGRRRGAVMGRWSLGQLRTGTSWRLHFVPSVPGFVVEGQFIHMPQAWNMDGDGYNCGADGFGFNIGNFAQDLCIAGDLIEESQVAPTQPFGAERVEAYEFPPGACLAPVLMGRAARPDQPSGGGGGRMVKSCASSCTSPAVFQPS